MTKIEDPVTGTSCEHCEAAIRRTGHGPLMAVDERGAA